MRFLFRVRHRGPLLLLALLGSPAAAGAQEQPPTPGKAVADSLRPFVANQSLAGAVVLVAAKDRVLCLEAVGYSDLEAHSLMGPRHLFWIASRVQKTILTNPRFVNQPL